LLFVKAVALDVAQNPAGKEMLAGVAAPEITPYER
jgi:hypothetical protein